MYAFSILNIYTDNTYLGTNNIYYDAWPRKEYSCERIT